MSSRYFIDVANIHRSIDKNLPPSRALNLKRIEEIYKCMFNLILFYLARLLLISPVKGQLLVTANGWQSINSDRRMLL